MHDKPLVQAKKRDFQLKLNSFCDLKEVVQVVNKTEIVGYFMSAEVYLGLTEANNKMLTNLLTNDDPDERKEECDLCGSDADYMTWYDGDEKFLCDPCIRKQYPSPKLYKSAIRSYQVIKR